MRKSVAQPLGQISKPESARPEGKKFHKIVCLHFHHHHHHFIFIFYFFIIFFKVFYCGGGRWGLPEVRKLIAFISIIFEAKVLIGSVFFVIIVGERGIT